MNRANTQIEDAFPLSSLQQGMIYHSLQNQALSVYHDVITFPIYQSWHPQRFEQALACMVKRHQALRTRFRLDKGRALQLVFAELEPEVLVTDLRYLAPAQQELAIAEWVQQEKEQGIELSKALWRIRILPCDDNKFQFGLSMHHALMDGWSVATLASELFTLYQQLAEGGAPAVVELPSYKLFIMQEQQAQKDEAQRQYWLNHLNDARLPWWAGSKKTTSERFTCDISAAQSEAVVALAARLGIQEKSLWCTVYLVLLSLLDGNTDIVGSVVTHGRPEVPGAERMLGLFLNTLPLRMDIADLSWQSLLQAVDASLRHQYPLRHFPLVTIQTLSKLDFAASMFNFMNFHVYSGAEASASASTEAGRPQLSGFDETNYLFSVNVQKQAGGHHLFVVNAEPTVFDLAFRLRISGYVENIVRSLLSAPAERPDRAALLGPQQCQWLLDEWNDTALSYAAELGLHQLFEQQARRCPQQIALVYQDQVLTYQALNQQANQLAHRLLALGVQREERVGVYLPRGPMVLVAILASLKCGACYVPIDPAYPAARVAYLLEDARLSCLLSSSELGATAADLPRLNLDQVWQQPKDSDHNPQLPYMPAQLAFVIYTSGSTGQPKGVALSHRGVLSLLAWAVHVLQPQDLQGVLASTSMCFDLSVYEFFLPLTTGNTCILIDNILLWAEQSWQLPVAVTLINTVPSAARALLEQQAIPDSVRVMNLAGEPLKAELVEMLYNQTHVEKVFDLYGPTEDTIYSTGKLRHRGAAESIGKPVANTQGYILDNQGQLCPPGVAGELYLAGDGLARGYLQRPALTAAQFQPNPYARTPGARMYKTGDLARYFVQADGGGRGDIQYLGRIDHQIKLRGFRIELGEIETCLLSHPQVRDSVVVVNEGPERGVQLVAYLVLHQSGDVLSTEQIRQYMKERLPAYQIPAVFVFLPKLPLNANGKIDRKALPAPGSLAETVYANTEPQGEIEQLLAGIWCGILQCGQVKRQQSFISLGGNSLHISRLSLRIREVFAVAVPLSQLFVLETVAAQAEEICRLIRSTATDAGLPVHRSLVAGETIDLTDNQRSLYFLHQYMEPGLTYNLPLALALQGPLDVPALQQAIEDLLQRHQALRTRFYAHDEQVVQGFDRAETFVLPVVEVTPGRPLSEVCQQLLQHVFDLTAESLVRIQLVREHAHSHVLLLNAHHVIADGWSFGVILRDLFELYQAHREQRAAALLSSPLQFSDYAGWQQQQDYQPALDYWRDQLADVPALLTLPTDLPRPERQSYVGATYLCHLSAELSAQLVHKSQQQGVTLFTTLISCFAVLLARYAGQAKLAIGTPVANRDLPGTDAMVGYLANTLAMRFDLSANPGFNQLLQQSRDMVIKSFAYQDLPFGQLVEAVNPQRSLSYSPLFQAMFVLQDADNIALPIVSELDLSFLQLSPSGSGARFDLTLSLVQSSGGMNGILEYNSELFTAGSMQLFWQHLTELMDALLAEPDSGVLAVAFRSQEAVGAYPDQCEIVNPFDDCSCCPIGVPGQLAIGAAGFPLGCPGHPALEGEWLSALDPAVVMHKTTVRARRLADGSLQLLAEPLDAGAAVVGRQVVAKTPATQVARPTNETERLLCEIWQQVLRHSVIGIDDNFFALGGDSILSIQVAAKARKYQLKVTVKQLFTYQTVRTLAAQISVLQPAVVWQPSVGDCALLPIQQWLLAKPDSSRQHFTQSMLFSVPAGFSSQYLPSLLAALVQKHEVFRLAFTEQAVRFVEFTALELQSCIRQIDISAMTLAEQQAEIAAVGEASKATMQLSQAPLLRMVFFAADTPQDSKLLLIAHHLVVDGVSWRILVQDLQQAYLLLSQGIEPQWSATAAPFALWAGRLHAAAMRNEFQQQESYWLQQLVSPAAAFFNHTPCQLPNLQRHSRSTEFYLNPAQTKAVLEAAYQAYKLQPEEVLLTAVLLAYHRTCGQEALTVMLESHGRAELFAELDITETVGWFTSLYPLHLRLVAAAVRQQQFDVVLKSVQQMMQVPLCGVGFGCLQRLEHSPVAGAARNTAVPLLFNYLGNFTSTGEKGRGFAVLDAWTGADIGADFARDQLVEITSAVVAGELSLHLRYHTELADCIGDFGDALAEVLTELGEYCRQQQYKSRTAADYPLVTVSQTEIAQLQQDYPTFTNLYPATPMQQGMMFHSLLDESRQAYSTQLAFVLEGDFRRPLFCQAWQLLLQRHEVLRTALTGMQRAQMLQVVQAEVVLPWQEFDWQAFTPEVQQELLAELCEADKKRGFNLRAAPLMRMTLCQLHPSKWVWLWSHHHSILDGWSVAVLINELFACYQALCQGQTPAITPQRGWGSYNQWLAAQNKADAVQFWTETLADVSPVLLAAEGSGRAPDSATTFPAEYIYECSAEFTAQIQQSARDYGVTPSTVIQAAWAYLLSRVSGQSSVVFGQTVSGRMADIDDIEAMVGLSIATIPVVVQFRPGLRLTDLLQQMQQQQVMRESFAYLPLTEICTCVAAGQQQTLFDSLVVFENFPLPDNKAELPQSGATPLIVNNVHVSEGTNYPLTLIIGGSPQLRLKFSYQRQQFSPAMIQQLQQRFLLILEAILQREYQCADELPYLSKAEISQINQWNETKLAVDCTVSLHQLFERQVALKPTSVALVCGQQTWSYADLNARANQLAHLLAERGVSPEDRVGILLSRTPDMLIAMLAVLKAGGCYVPLDPAYPASRINYLLEDSAVKHLIREIEGPVFSAMSDIPFTVTMQTEDLQHYPATNLQQMTSSQQLAYLIYTSGSTGKPKGVAISHQNAVNLLMWAQTELSPQDLQGVLASTSMCFDLSVYELFLPLVTGHVCVLTDSILSWQPKNSHADYPVTLINTVPSAAKILLEHDKIGESVRVINLAGEPLKPAVVDALYQYAPKLRVFDLYGPSEYTTYATWTQRQLAGRETIGCPLANSQIHLVSATSQLCAVGQVGEICLAGLGLARGYLNKPAATAEKFVPNPYATEPGQRLYRTGDLARYLEDGNLQYIGRIDHQIKLRGFRIELGEIESLLLSQRQVKDVVVVASGVTGPATCLVAYVVLHDGEGSTEAKDELFAVLHRTLPSYMVPTDLMLLMALPLSPNGKVDRAALPQPGIEAVESCLPVGETELALATLWRELLAMTTINRTDSFFRIGGNSVLAMRLMALISGTFGVDLPMRSVFDQPTLQELAALIEYYRFNDFDDATELDSFNNYLELDI